MEGAPGKGDTSEPLSAAPGSFGVKQLLHPKLKGLSGVRDREREKKKEKGKEKDKGRKRERRGGRLRNHLSCHPSPEGRVPQSSERSLGPLGPILEAPVPRGAHTHPLHFPPSCEGREAVESRSHPWRCHRVASSLRKRKSVGSQEMLSRPGTRSPNPSLYTSAPESGCSGAERRASLEPRCPPAPPSCSPSTWSHEPRGFASVDALLG